MAELQPTRFGKYLLLKKLAIGGTAQLDWAKITGIQGFEKPIAIKTILPHLTGDLEECMFQLFFNWVSPRR